MSNDEFNMEMIEREQILKERREDSKYRGGNYLKVYEMRIQSN